MIEGDGQIWLSSSEVLTLLFIYFIFLDFSSCCHVCGHQSNYQHFAPQRKMEKGLVLFSGTKRFPRNPGRFPNGGCELDSFPCKENQGKRGVNEAERILGFHCGDYSTQTKHQRLWSTFLLWFHSSLQWKFLVFIQPHVNVCFRNHAAPVLASGFPFLALKSQLFSSENSNDLLIILAKVGFCVKYILYYNPWNQPVFI